MSLEVDIANVEVTDNTLEVAVFVTTDTTETIDYALNINDTATGGIVTRRGTLVGGAGSYPGDTQTERVSFGVNRSTGGTVTATITEPEEYVGAQDQVKWGDQDPTTQFDITQCANTPTQSGDLEVDYSISPVGAAGGGATVEIRVDGQVVGSATHFVPGRGGGFSQTIPASQLPLGEDMPVEVGVSGDFRDCGTVTTERDSPAGGGDDGPVDVSLSCSGLPSSKNPGEQVQITYDVENNGDSRADVTVQLLRNGSLMDTQDVSVFPATTRTGNFYTRVGGEPGEYTFEIQTA